VRFLTKKERKLNNEISVPEQGKLDRAARREGQEGKIIPGKLMIATPVYMSQEFSTYGDSMLETVRMLDKAGIPWQKQTIRGDSYIDRAKNSILANFLESDCESILMVDSDMDFAPDAVARMIRHPQEIVAGFFCMKNAWGTFAGALLPDEDGNIPDIKTAIELWDGSCLFKAHLLPGGFLRIKRDVLERFADHYPELVYQDPCADPSKPDRVYTAFFECMIHDYVRFGEDATFCRRMREMGETLWCDPNITFGHTGVKTYTGNYNDSLLKSPEELEAILKDREGVKAVRYELETE
jgi:hypothetical protein